MRDSKSEHEYPQETQGDDDEGERDALTRDDPESHPQRNGRQPYHHAGTERAAILVTNEHGEPADRESDGKGPRRRNDTRGALPVVVVGTADDDEEQDDDNVNNYPTSIHSERP